MPRRWVGLLILLAGSLILGTIAGQRFYRLFVENVPPATLTDNARTYAHGQYLLNGALLGIVVALWAAVALLLARFFRGPAARPEAGSNRR